HRTVLRLTIPSAVFELLIKEPGDDLIDILTKVGAERNDHSIDARLDLAAKKLLTGVVPSAIRPHLPQGAKNLFITRIDPEVLQVNKHVRRRGPRLRFVPIPLPIREQRATGPLAVCTLQGQ